MTGTEIVASALLIGGAVLGFLGGLGLLQFESVFSRMHASTKALTFGLVLVVLGASLRVATAVPVSKLLLVAVFQLLTAPIAAHMVGRAAYRSGTELSPRTQVDELAGDGNPSDAAGG